MGGTTKRRLRERRAGGPDLSSPRPEEFEVVRFPHRGLRVLHQFRSGGLTAISLSVRAGARYDGASPGLAHVAEHMLFQGTDSLDQVALNRRAAELGGEHNAETGYEELSLTIEVFNEDVDGALELLADQYYHTRIEPQGFRKERRVVLEEIRGHLDDPAERASQQAWSRFFDGALSHPVCGTLSSVRRLDCGRVEAFLRRHFTHANTVLVTVGGVSVPAVRRAVKKYFKHGRSRPPVSPPAVRRRRSGCFALRDDRSAQVYLSTLMGAAPDARRLLATGVAVDLIGGDPDSRMFQEIRERLGLSYEVSADLEWGPDWAAVVVSASANRGQAGRLRGAIEETFRKAASGGFSDAEVERARKKIRYRYASLADNRMEQAACLAESALWGFPAPRAAERIVCDLSKQEIEDAWRGVLAQPGVTVMLGV